MELYHREFGGSRDAPPVVILHGLFGSSNSWHAVARSLAESFRVHLFDLRNHGRSPHAPTGTLHEMADDVTAAIRSVESRPAYLLGHSLGGKVAMRVAVSQPELVRHLVVVDIAPKAYRPISTELQAMRDLDLSTLSSRSEADERLKSIVPDTAMRLFLLTNLTRSTSGWFTWRCNLDALHASMPDMRQSPLAAGEVFAGESTYILGELSDFVDDEDQGLIRSHFPRAQIGTIAGSGHNPHLDQREAFERVLISAVSRSSSSSSETTASSG